MSGDTLGIYLMCVPMGLLVGFVAFVVLVVVPAEREWSKHEKEWAQWRRDNPRGSPGGGRGQDPEECRGHPGSKLRLSIEAATFDPMRQEGNRRGGDHSASPVVPTPPRGR